MAIELNFSKSESEVWGFRITGGAEYDVPLIVVKVNENSVAENGGLLENDVIVRINDVSTSGLTHEDAHNLLVSSGNNLVLAVRRDLLSLDSNNNDDEICEEISSLLQPHLENGEPLKRETYYEIVNENASNTKNECKLEQTSVQISQIDTTTAISESSNAVEKKWSTFLQRPNNPKPILKPREEPPKGEPYRVIIKKQPKKTSKPVCKADAQNIEETVLEQVENIAACIQEAATSDECVETEYSFQAKVTEEETVEIVEQEGYEEKVEETTAATKKEEIKKRSAAERLLEEKLAEVQKQLEALSKLPITIQSTIESVTKQLASIVSAQTVCKTEYEETITLEEEEEEKEEEENDDNLKENSFCENELEEQASINSIDEDAEDFKNIEEHLDEPELEEVLLESANDVQTLENKAEQLEVNTEIIDEDDGLTEEEREAKRIEEQILQKQQKEQEKNTVYNLKLSVSRPSLPSKPIQRPIILPGGRRWSEPDDACPAVRHPKMTDDKIANTIETFSEVITGKTKGINFLKYQPPPKNLEYLQKSDVFKLVHDLDPPPRGISSRETKVLAEQDYQPARE